MQHTVPRVDSDVPSGTPFNPNVAADTPSARPRSAVRRPWTPDPSQTVARTTSRHSGPRAWRRAAERALEAGLVPGANAVTTVVLEDLARRMDYSTGHVRYCLADTMASTDLSRSTVTKHIRLLRSAGWLAWAEHGSLRNVLRGLGRPGYAPTATVYAATIPPAFDTWAGNRLGGVGYSARVVGATARGREQRVAEAVDNSSRKAVDNPAKRSSRTPSLRVVKEEGQVQVVGGSSTAKRQRKTTILGSIPTADAVARARRLAAEIRPLVNWLQKASRRQLSWVLLDLVLMGWDDQRILNWVRAATPYSRSGQGVWRPRFPHRVLAAALLGEDQDARRIADLEALTTAAVAPKDHEAWGEVWRTWQEQLADSTEPERTDEDRCQARAYVTSGSSRACGTLAEVTGHIAVYGLDDALDLYGTHLCSLAERMDAIGAYA
jgi:hypothetical protein